MMVWVDPVGGKTRSAESGFTQFVFCFLFFFEMLYVFLHLGSSSFDGLVQYSIAGRERERETRMRREEKRLG